MHNSVAKKEGYIKHGTPQFTSVEQNVVGSVVPFVTQDQMVAQTAEEACHLEGNLNSPDFDVFEQKYKLTCFA